MKPIIPLAVERQREPFKGDLLLSEPFLMDDHFTRSVIFICDHNQEGTFGLVLNNTLDVTMNDLLTDFPQCFAPVGLGGPVEPQQVFFLHKNDGVKDSEHISELIYLGGDYDALKEGIISGSFEVNELRFFIGYSGWAPGQLKEELKQGAWLVVTPPEHFNVFEVDDEHLWKKLVNDLGGAYAAMADYPINPSDN
jgi:putative transcriptional regulator